MRRRGLFAIWLILLVSVSLRGAVRAQAQPRPARLSIYIEHSGDDSVGARVIYQVKELLRASRGLSLSDNSKTADLTLYVTSLDDTCGDVRGLHSAMAMVLVDADHVFMTDWISTVGSQRVQERAEGIVAYVDKELSTWTFKK